MTMKAAINCVTDSHLQVLYTPTARHSTWLDRKDSLCWMALPARRAASKTSYIWSHGIRCGPASSSGLGSLTKMSPLQVTDQMAWWEGGPWIRLLSQQDMFSKDSYGTRSREPKASIYSGNKNFHRCLSITKWNFITSAGSCKSAKWIISFFSKALEFSGLEIINTITGTNMVWCIWSLWSIFQVFHCSVCICWPMHKICSNSENSSCTNAEEQTNWIKLLTHL